jgi:all-trans-retinol 13,14-reductase
MRRYSTGALTQLQRAQQNRIYQQNHQYDYIIIGTGMAALTVGALLAHAGLRICMLEAHDKPGGYAHTFSMNDFHFCAQVHYIWGCAPGQPIYEFLKYIGLHDEIKFVPYDPSGYDQMVMPDGKKIKIPYGFDQVIDSIESAYPGQRKNLVHFFSILDKITTGIAALPSSKKKWWKTLSEAFKVAPLIKYKNKTLQNVYDECHLSKEAQAILNANSGDLMSPPEKLSILAFHGLFKGYNGGAYYPEKHFKFFIERLANFITEHKGCHILYESVVTKINKKRSIIDHVVTQEGKIFKAPNYICNMDPQKASYMIGREEFPKQNIPFLSYEYSPSSLIVYLGIKGIDLRDYGFGNYNIWHLEQWNINQIWKDIQKNCYDKPWVFFSTPTLHTSYPGIAPEGCQILELGTAANYDYFKNLYDEDPAEYRKQKRRLANHLLQITAKNYIPNLEKHIALKVVGTPLSNEAYCYAPYGNCYGSSMTPVNMGLNRLKTKSPWTNFHWCNSSSGFAGIYGTTITGMHLYEQLTNDHFYDYDLSPSAEEAIKYANDLLLQKK